MTRVDPNMLERWRTAVEAELPTAVELRRRVHLDPEPSGAERRTADRVVGAIDVEDVLDICEVAGTGRLVRIGADQGPSIAVRAELDALPGTEDPGNEHAASNGFMHTCGHDVHLSAVVALVRAARRLDLPVPIVALFQPREEHPPSGARDIVGAKVLQEHDVRAVIGAHLQPLLTSGTVAATPGAVNAAADTFEIVVHGRGGHGGYPHLTRDPVLAMAQILTALQQVVSRRIDPLHAAVLTVGKVQAGSAPNVIPDEARAEGTLRVLEEADRGPAHEELAAIVENTAAAFGCRGEVRVHEGEPALVNEPRLTGRTHAWLDALGFELSAPLRSCGADDFSYYGQVAPSLMMFVGVPAREGATEPTTLHHPTFYPPDESVRDVALALLAGYLGAVDSIARPTGVSR
jgi:amidohydrolase